jgi:hypothetical protein
MRNAVHWKENLATHLFFLIFPVKCSSPPTDHKQVCTEKLADVTHLPPRPCLEGANSHSVPAQLLLLNALGDIVLCVSFGLLKRLGVHERVIVSNQGWFNHLGELGGRLERPNLGRKSEEAGWNYILRKRVVFKWSGREEPANLSFALGW